MVKVARILILNSLWVLKATKRDGVRGLGSLSYVFSPTKRQGTE